MVGYDLLVKMRKLLKRVLIVILFPLRWYLDIDKVNKRYQKKRDKLTSEKAEYLIARGIARYVVKYQRDEVRIHSADWVDVEQVGGMNFEFIALSMLNKKERMAYYELELSNQDVQERIIEHLKKYKKIRVSKEQDEIHDWDKREYRHTYHISYR